MDKFWNIETGLPAWVRAVAVAGMRLLPKAVVVARHAAFMERLQHTVAEWEARPAARPQLEAVLTERLSDRVRPRLEWVAGGAGAGRPAS